jgi:hypothetical protein
MTNNETTTTSTCTVCGQRVELVPGTPGSTCMTPFWRHHEQANIGDVRTTGVAPHPAQPNL